VVRALWELFRAVQGLLVSVCAGLDLVRVLVAEVPVGAWRMASPTTVSLLSCLPRTGTTSNITRSHQLQSILGLG
jgi:hypothetical protein